MQSWSGQSSGSWKRCRRKHEGQSAHPTGVTECGAAATEFATQRFETGGYETGSRERTAGQKLTKTARIGTARYAPGWRFAHFKTGALNRSATHPAALI